jgi:hypothetical protein
MDLAAPEQVLSSHAARQSKTRDTSSGRRNARILLSQRYRAVFSCRLVQREGFTSRTKENVAVEMEQLLCALHDLCQLLQCRCGASSEDSNL